MTIRKITLLMLIPVGIIYIGRVLLDSFFNQFHPYGTFLWESLPLLCCIAFISAFLALLVAIYSVYKAKHPLPALVLLGGLLLLPFLPLPPSSAPVFPEEAFFYEHRTEFEQVIQLVRRNELNCPSSFGCSVPLRDLPRQYAALTKEGAAFVLNSDPTHLQVRFNPPETNYPVVYFMYFAAPQDRDSGYDIDCNSGQRWDKKLDTHWFLCVEQWM